MLGIILAGSMMPIAARAGTVFTWDPAGASPSLGGSAFTADAIQGEHYLYSNQPSTTLVPLNQQTPYTVSFIEQIQGFTLNGAPVATPGLNGNPGAAGSYGLYLSMQANVLYVGPPKT